METISDIVVGGSDADQCLGSSRPMIVYTIVDRWLNRNSANFLLLASRSKNAFLTEYTFEHFVIRPFRYNI